MDSSLARTACWPAIVTHFGICPNRAKTEYLGWILETCLGAT
jgi:hypothetical protein